jgi:hypothetical protein
MQFVGKSSLYTLFKLDKLKVGDKIKEKKTRQSESFREKKIIEIYEIYLDSIIITVEDGSEILVRKEYEDIYEKKQ